MESWSRKTPKQSFGIAQLIKPGFSVRLCSFSLCVLFGQDGDHSRLLVAGNPAQHDSEPQAGKSHPDPVLSSAQPGRGSFGSEGHGDLPVPVAQCTRCGPPPWPFLQASVGPRSPATTPTHLQAKDAAGMAQLTPSHRVPCLWKPTEHGCWHGVGWHRPSGNAPVKAGSYTGAAASATSSIRLHCSSQHPARCSFPWPQGTRCPSTSQSHSACCPS